MDNVYINLLKTYIKETSKLVEERITKTDLIIQDETNTNKINKQFTDF